MIINIFYSNSFDFMGQVLEKVEKLYDNIFESDYGIQFMSIYVWT